MYGSYARGAGSVGDIDLAIEVDDPQDPSRAALDGYQAYIRGGNPDSDVLKALSAGGNSIVQATVLRNHDPELGWPLPVEDLALLPAAERQRFAPAVPPVLQHAGTGEPLDAREMRLRYCRGESVAGAHERLASIRAGELPEAVEAALEQRFRVQARRRGSKALSQIIGVEDQLVAAGGRLGTDVELWIRHDGAPWSWLGSDERSGPADASAR